jgi:hypothetical protein
MLEIGKRERKKTRRKMGMSFTLVSLGDITVIRCCCVLIYTRKTFLFFSLVLVCSRWINKNVVVVVSLWRWWRWWWSIFLVLYLISRAKNGWSKQQTYNLLSFYDVTFFVFSSSIFYPYYVNRNTHDTIFYDTNNLISGLTVR